MKAMATKTLKNLKSMVESAVGGLKVEEVLEAAKRQVRRPSQAGMGPPDVHSAIDSVGRGDLSGPQLCRLLLFYQLQGGAKDECAALTADRLRHFMTLANNLFPSSKDVQQAYVDKKVRLVCVATQRSLPTLTAHSLSFPKGFPAEVFWNAVKKTYACSFKLKNNK